MYYDIAPAIPLPPSRDIFTYQSDNSLAAGTIVRIPIGRRQVNGVVIQKIKKKPPYKTKSVIRAYSATLTTEQLAYGAQIAGLMLGGLGFTLRLLYPPSLRAEPTIAPYSSRKTVPMEPQVVVASFVVRLKYIEQQVKQVQKDGGQALILVPERSMLARFPWAKPLHAGMNISQAQPVWDAVAAGEPIVVVGTQKALYLPWRNLTSIVIDEVQLPTHKLWDGYPRGDNRRLVDLAMEIYRPTPLFGASFPSVSLYHAVRQTKQLKAAKWTPKLPSYEIVAFSFGDRRQGRLLPEDLVGLLRNWKNSKKHVLILHNEKESNVAKALRSLRLLKKDQIVIGTSAMFASLQDKKFDHVVWMFPEHALSAADFRSRERAYLLLARLHSMQKSSRKAVFLVTRQASFVDQSFLGELAQVYKEILTERKKYLYPPYTDMVKLTFRSRTVAEAEKRAANARKFLEKKLVAERESTRILGPYGTRPPKGSKTKPEKHILLLGDLQKLAPAYRGVLPDAVDIDPERVL